MKTLRDQEFAMKQMYGTSLKGYLNVTYNQLVQILGEPTFNEASGDDKTQVEWVIKFRNKYYTVYDWKTYDREYTLNQLDYFHVGSKTNAVDFIAILNDKLK